MKTSLSPSAIQSALGNLVEASAEFDRHYPGDTGCRQPVHAVYGGAHLFRAETARRLGDLALAALQEYAPDAITFARALGLPGAASLPGSAKQQAALTRRFASSPEKLRMENPDAWLACTVYARVLEKLQCEPVEDFHIDFEDGYGFRPDEEEDQHAKLAAEETARGLAAGSLPPFIGIRIKPFSPELRDRSIRTLDLFLTTLCEATRGRLPERFAVALPKVIMPEQPAALANLLTALEASLGLSDRSVHIELMIEAAQAVLNSRGESNLPLLLDATAGRCLAVHLGPYDYTASCGITSVRQSLTHPACDFARNVIQIAFAGTGVFLSDGPTNVLPLPVYRAEKGKALACAQREANRKAIHHAWQVHFANIQHALSGGYYQGWDLHPAQLPARYAAVYSFFREGLDPAAARLKNFIEKAAKATSVGGIFDDAATGQGLLNYFLRAINCGAIPEEEAGRLTGVSAEELRLGSFLKILKNRAN
jgi:citrate lyase beta subunit